MVEFNKILNRIWGITNHSKIRTLQYRLLHQSITINKMDLVLKLIICITIVKMSVY